jgi:hypothetical protein
MDIDGPTVTEDGASARATFFDTVFVEVPPPPLVAPPAFTAEPPAPTLQLQAKRQSSRLAARLSFVPMALKATHRLIRQLDIVG